MTGHKEWMLFVRRKTIFADVFCIFKHFCLTLILLYSASTDTCEPHFGVFENEYNQPNTGVNNFKKPRRYRGSLVQ